MTYIPPRPDPVFNGRKYDSYEPVFEAVSAKVLAIEEDMKGITDSIYRELNRILNISPDSKRRHFRKYKNYSLCELFRFYCIDARITCNKTVDEKGTCYGITNFKERAEKIIGMPYDELIKLTSEERLKAFERNHQPRSNKCIIPFGFAKSVSISSLLTVAMINFNRSIVSSMLMLLIALILGGIVFSKRRFVVFNNLSEEDLSYIGFILLVIPSVSIATRSFIVTIPLFFTLIWFCGRMGIDTFSKVALAIEAYISFCINTLMKIGRLTRKQKQEKITTREHLMLLGSFIIMAVFLMFFGIRMTAYISAVFWLIALIYDVVLLIINLYLRPFYKAKQTV